MPKKLRILFFEDDYSYATLISKALQKEFKSADIRVFEPEIISSTQGIKSEMEDICSDSILLCIVNTSIENKRIGISISEKLNNLSVKHVVLSASLTQNDEFKKIRPLKYCLNVFTKTSIENVVYQLFKAVQNALQHHLQLKNIERSNKQQALAGIFMERFKINYTNAMAQVKSVCKEHAEKKGVSFHEAQEQLFEAYEAISEKEIPSSNEQHF